MQFHGGPLDGCVETYTHSVQISQIRVFPDPTDPNWGPQVVYLYDPEKQRYQYKQPEGG